MCRNVLITGATGLVGGYFLSRLMKDESVKISVIIRNKEKVSSEKRLESLLKYFSINDNDKKICLYEGDVCKDNLGLSDTDYRKIKEGLSDIFHSAADISFNQKDNYSQINTNITGTENMLKLADHDTRFFYVSSSYVAGNYCGTFKESDLDKGQTFKNSYEKSKYVSEQIVRKNFVDCDHLLTVIRPSIITGEYTDGKTFQFEGLYKLLKIFHILRAKKIKRTLLMDYNPDSTKNYIPINYLTDMIEEIFQSGTLWGKTYNLVNDKPLRNSEMAYLIREVFNLEIVNMSKNDKLSFTDELLMKKTDHITPYLKSEPEFGCDNRNELKSSKVDMSFTAEYLNKLTDFFRSTNWGREIELCR